MNVELPVEVTELPYVPLSEMALQTRQSFRTNRISYRSTDSEKPHRCCHLPNKDEQYRSHAGYFQ